MGWVFGWGERGEGEKEGEGYSSKDLACAPPLTLFTKACRYCWDRQHALWHADDVQQYQLGAVTSHSNQRSLCQCVKRIRFHANTC